MCASKQHLLDHLDYFHISTSIYFEPKKKEIRVKSTKLKYKNKGLKLKSIYEYNFTFTSSAVEQDGSIVRMTILLLWQKRGSLDKPNASLGNCVAMWGCQRSMDLWICFMVGPGLKANSKKIEGRLFESHPRSYPIIHPPTHTHLYLSRSHRLVCRSRRQIHYPEKLKRKPNRAVCAMCGLLR